MTPQKVVFIDIDGTLTSSGDNSIPPSAVSACRTARKNGHLLYLCTGRAPVEIDETVRGIGFDGIVSGGGAHIQVGGKTIFRTQIPPETLKSIIVFLNERKMGYWAETETEIIPGPYFLNRIKDKKDTGIEVFFAALSKKTGKLPEDFQNAGVQKIIFIEDKYLPFEKIRNEFSAECEVFRGSFELVGKDGGEIGPAGVHKGAAIERVIRYVGAAHSQTIAFGDSDNDRTMLSYAAIGIAMENAPEELKQIADDVTDAPEDDGLYKAFQKYHLL